MKRDTSVCLLVAVFLFLACSSKSSQEKAAIPLADAHLQAREVASYTHLPLSFELNEGQVNPRAKYLARGRGFTLFLTRADAILELAKPDAMDQESKVPRSQSGHGTQRGTDFRLLPRDTSLFSNLKTAEEPNGPSQSSAYSQTEDVVRLKLLGANQNAKITGENQLPGRTSYFVGNDPQHWHTNIPNYASVLYDQAYPGISIVYHGHQGRLENDFVLSPGSDPKLIRIGLEGVEAMHVDRAGDLVLKVDGGKIYLRQPKAYQGQRKVKVHYVLRGKNDVGFKLGTYNRQQKLVIDPVLSYSTYLGGNGGDTGYGMAVDTSGDAYVTGTTASLNFPTTESNQTTAGAGRDIFVTKFNPAGSALVYSVFMGGGSSDTATGIAIDSSGDAYIVGYTSSSDFPATSGAFQVSNAGGIDAFVTKLNPTGSSLVYSTYLGGSGDDYGRAIAVDASGDAYITGSTDSTDLPTMNPLQVGNDGGSDAFLAEFNPSGTGLLYSTYLGGSGADYGLSIALDSKGDAYIAGNTFSSDFPTQSALQSTLSGPSDAFVSEINPETSSLVFSTYLGGSGMDSAQAIALDSSGNIYLAGSTTSNDFPVTPGAFQSSNHGQGDAFVAKLSPGATQVVHATYLGGSGADQANGIAIDSSGDAFVTGSTQSSDFPLANAIQRVLGISGASTCGTTLCSDAFVSEFGPSGSIIYSTFLGGSAADAGQAIAVDTSGAAYITGSTVSTNFPVIAGAPQSTYAGSNSSPNAFVAKIGSQDAPAAALSPQKLNFGNQALNTSSTSQTVTLMNAGSAPLEITSISASGEFSETNTCGTVVPAGGGTCTIQVTFTPNQTGPVTDQISITDNAQGSPQTITVTGTGVTSAGTLTLSPSSLTFPSETVGETSPPQTVQLVNSGTTAVNISSITASGDFAQTNTCGNLPAVLNVGAACSITVTFTPTATGSRSGSVTVEDDASNNPQSLILTGTANAVFSLSSNVRSSSILIGTQSTTFTISAVAPSSFQGNIALSCSSGTCSFNPPSITSGETSTLTVSGLASNISTSGPAPPTNFTVTGTSGNQSTTVPLTIFFQDFSLSQTPPTPPLNTITAGQSATYAVTVTPSNGFNQVILLGCSNLPQGTDATPQKPDTTCTFSPPGLTMNGTSSATATLTISTTAQKSSFVGPSGPRGAPPPGTNSGFAWWYFLIILGMISAVFIGRRIYGAKPMPLRTKIAVVAMGALMTVFMAGCNTNYIGPTTTPVTTGTPAGTYTINIIGTLGSNSSVQRTTTVNLSVQP